MPGFGGYTAMWEVQPGHPDTTARRPLYTQPHHNTPTFVFLVKIGFVLFCFGDFFAFEMAASCGGGG